MKQGYKNIKWMFRFVKPFRWTYIIGLMLFASQIFTANYIQAKFLGDLSDGILKCKVSLIERAIITFTILFIIQLVITLIGITLYNISTIKAEKELKFSLFSCYLRKTQRELNTRHSGSMINSLNSDADAALLCFGNSFSLLVFSTFTIVGSIIVILTIDVRLGLFTTLLGIGATISQVYYAKPIKSVSEQILKSQEKSINCLTDILRGLDTIKTCNLENRMLESYTYQIKNMFLDMRKKNILRTYQNVFKTLFGALSTVGIFLLGIYIVSEGKLEFAKFIIIPTLSVGVIDAMAAIGNQWSALQTPIAAVDRIKSVFDTMEILKEGNIELDGEFQNIEIKNLTFVHDGQKELIQNVSLEIGKNEFVVITGESGCGKSTLLNVILGNYNVQNETLIYNGIPIEKVIRKSWRRQFAYVEQDCKLFHMNIMENIRIGRPGASDDEVFDAAKLAGCMKFISKLPEGFHTIIGENKTGLSGGECQRICIARALLRQANVLVFDEITSALDKKTEGEILDLIDTIREQYTIIFVTHNLEIVKRADKAVVLNARVSIQDN